MTDLSTDAKRFRFVAVAEAISWFLLLVGMVFKRVITGPLQTDMLVTIFGWTHGLIFVAFVIIAILTARALRWSAGVTVLALLSSLPPFCTALFEVWVQRTGRLGELSEGRDKLTL